MAKATIYLDDELAKRVKAAKLPISRICQAALERKVKAAETLPAGHARHNRQGSSEGRAEVV
jgi:post-segregation antitoxin (ccd killing protein)